MRKDRVMDIHNRETTVDLDTHGEYTGSHRPANFIDPGTPETPGGFGSADRIGYKEMTIDDPDATVHNPLVLLDVHASKFPDGIVIIACGIIVAPSSTYSVDFKKFSSPSDAAPITIETVATSGATEAEDSGGIDNSVVGAGDIVYVDLPVTDIDQLTTWMTYKIPAPVDYGTEGSTEKTVDDPDSLANEPFVLLNVHPSRFPFGITITACGIITEPGSTLSVDFKKLTSPSDGSPVTIETVATAGTQEAEDNGTIANPIVLAGDIVYADLITGTGIAQLTCWIAYKIHNQDDVDMVDWTMDDPDTVVSEPVLLLNVHASMYPNGITVIACGIITAPSSSYEVTFKNFSSPSDGSPVSIETVATSGSREAEDDGTIDNPDVDVGSIVYVDLPATDIDGLYVWMTYIIR